MVRQNQIVYKAFPDTKLADQLKLSRESKRFPSLLGMVQKVRWMCMETNQELFQFWGFSLSPKLTNRSGKD